MIALLSLLACAQQPARDVPVAVNQWVWTKADVPLLASLRATHPTAVAGVHVATIRYGAMDAANPGEDPAAVHVDLGLPPTAVPAPVALVIRIDDSVNAAWDADPGLVADLGDALGRILALARTREVGWSEVQIDYDVPVRRLPEWAAALSALQRGSLAGETVWVTSLVSHLRAPRYGELMRPLVAGDIVQVFDTGDNAVAASAIASLANATAVPWRLGVGAFERVHGDGTVATSHRAWFSSLDTACPAPLCTAVWVFPGGEPYADLLPAAPGR